jgi:NAD+ kinase
MNTKPQVMIIYKRSPLLSAGTSIAAANERFRANHACHYASLRKVIAILKDLGIDSYQHLRGCDAAHHKHDMIITVGGDGTFLDAARRSTEKQLILGVNSDPSWSVGQFCAATADTFEKILKNTLTAPRSKKIYKLKAEFNDKNTPGTVECLNDILVCHANPAAMSRYSIAIGKKSEQQRSSGVWLSSAAGSTGAMASAGGMRLPIEKRDIVYKPRELYLGRGNPYLLSGGIVRSGQSVTITSMMPHGRVFFDGSHIKHPLIFGKTIKVSASAHFIQMVVHA